MIDFRYHLVSLVAVFLALAIGVVLGAGPLGEELATTLEQQVEELREERGQLRAELDHTARSSEAKDELVASLITPAVNDRLTGVRLGLVLLPGADRDLAEQIRRVVAVGGGETVLTARVSGDAEDPDNAATRHEAASELAPLVADPEPREGGEPTLATVLAAVVAGADEEGGNVGQWRSVALRLEDLELVELEWEGSDEGQLPGAEDQRAPEAVIVLSPGLEQDPEDPEAVEVLALRTDTVTALAAAGLPTVVAGAGADRYDADGDSTDPLVAAVRNDNGLSSVLSTVDNADTRAGHVAIAYAAAHALEDEYGHWGLGTGAQGPAPPVPPLRALSEETTPGPVPAPDPLDDDADDGAAEGAETTDRDESAETASEAP